MCGVQVTQGSIAQGLCIPPGVGELLCFGQLHVSSLLQLLLRVNGCHPACVQDVPSHSCLPFVQLGQISSGGLLGMSRQGL